MLKSNNKFFSHSCLLFYALINRRMAFQQHMKISKPAKSKLNHFEKKKH